jgi:putative phosphoribosyl transferase
MIFENREDAGRQLAKQLAEFAQRPDAIVLGIPRGGVVVASEIAEALHLPLDIFLSHKLGVPGHEELAFGAIAAGQAKSSEGQPEQARYLDDLVIRAEGVSAADIERVTAEVEQMLNQRAVLYRRDRPPLEVEGRTVILVDDGIATGASAFAAIQALRQMKPATLVLAVPVAPASTCAWLRRLVDRLFCLYAPRNFFAVGQFFESFPQSEDQEIVALLHRAE